MLHVFLMCMVVSRSPVPFITGFCVPQQFYASLHGFPKTPYPILLCGYCFHASLPSVDRGAGTIPCWKRAMEAGDAVWTGLAQTAQEEQAGSLWPRKATEGRRRQGQRQRQRALGLLIRLALPCWGDRIGEGVRAESCQSPSLGGQVVMGFWLGCPCSKIIS